MSTVAGLVDGKVALVSGIGPGMGRDIALLLAEHGASLALLMSEWRQLYRHPERDLPPLPPVGFRDCALADRALQTTPRWRDALAWWSARRPDLDVAPETALAIHASAKL